LLLPATAALAALTAVTLCGAAIAVRPPPPLAEADAPQEAANRALVSAFYEAANAAIASGDPTAVAAVVAPDFAERSLVPDAEADRDGLVRRLLAIHATNPALRLATEAVAADGDLVIAHVRVDGVTGAAFAGLRLAGDWSAWGSVDVFRVERGRIVERWGPPVQPVPPPAWRIALELPPPADRTLKVRRLELEPGATYQALTPNGSRLVLVEAGTVAIGPIPVRPVAPASPALLAAGEHVVLPAGSSVAASNAGPTPAVLLDVALGAPPWGAALDAPLPPEEGVTVHTLFEDLLIAVPAPAAVVSVGRVTVEPGEPLAWEAAPGPVLLHVEAGEVGLTTSATPPWARAVASERSGAGVATTLAAGGGALLEVGTAAEIRAALGQPATVLVLTLLPADTPVPGHPPIP
jgi:predicted SnoaL-like aldol condensation-catalyzing enzyme